MEAFPIWGWDLILPGCGEALAGGATLPAGWLNEPQPISAQSIGVGFPHRDGRYRPRGSPLSSTESWTCRCIEGFMIRRWDVILPGCGETSTSTRGATPPARWLHESQSSSGRWIGVGLPYHAGRYRPGGSPFIPEAVGVVDVWKDL